MPDDRGGITSDKEKLNGIYFNRSTLKLSIVHPFSKRPSPFPRALGRSQTAGESFERAVSTRSPGGNCFWNVSLFLAPVRRVKGFPRFTPRYRRVIGLPFQPLDWQPNFHAIVRRSRENSRQRSFPVFPSTRLLRFLLGNWRIRGYRDTTFN